jgi:hypothetical protein
MSQLSDLPILPPVQFLSTDDFIPVWDQADNRSPKRATVAEILALSSSGTPAPLSVTTDEAKRALTGITAGQIVVITGEANRIELYRGGTISDQANWTVLRNTVELEVQFSGMVDSYQVGDTSFGEGIGGFVGWVDPLNIPLLASVSGPASSYEITLNIDSIINFDTGAIPKVENASPPLSYPTPNGGPVTIPMPLLDRSYVLLTITSSYTTDESPGY